MRRTSSSRSRTCAPSAATIATPIAARCQRSWWSTSATDACARSRMRSLSERTTWRLSLSERAAGTCSSMRTMPTTIAFPSRFGGPPLRAARRRGSERARELLDRERLEPVAFLQIAPAVERDAALEALLDFAHVVLETLERRVATGPQRFAAAHEPDLVLTRHLAGLHHAAGDRDALRQLEDLTDLGDTVDDFFQFRLEHALERALHVLDGLVDDVVETDLDLL